MKSDEKDSNHVLSVKKYLSKRLNLKLDNIGDIPWKGKNRFTDNAKKGDQFINIYKNGKSGFSVFAFSSILKIEDEGILTRFYYDQTNDHNYLSWTDFFKKIKTMNLDRNILKNRTRRLSKNDAEEILKLFKMTTK